MGRVAGAAPQLAPFSRRFTRKPNPQEIPRLQNPPRPLRLRRQPRTGKSGMNVPLSSEKERPKNSLRSYPGLLANVTHASANGIPDAARPLISEGATLRATAPPIGRFAIIVCSGSAGVGFVPWADVPHLGLSGFCRHL